MTLQTTETPGQGMETRNLKWVSLSLKQDITMAVLPPETIEENNILLSLFQLLGALLITWLMATINAFSPPAAIITLPFTSSVFKSFSASL